MNNPYTPPAAPPGAYPYPPPQAPGLAPEGAVEMLRLTRPWVMILSILLFVGAAFMLVLALVMIVGGVAAGMETGSKALPAFLGLVYVPIAFVYVYPAIKLWMYGSAIARAVASRAVADLENALLQQKSFWKYCGIAAIALIALYVVGIIGAIAVGVATGMSNAH